MCRAVGSCWRRVQIWGLWNLFSLNIQVGYDFSLQGFTALQSPGEPQRFFSVLFNISDIPRDIQLNI